MSLRSLFPSALLLICSMFVGCASLKVADPAEDVNATSPACATAAGDASTMYMDVTSTADAASIDGSLDASTMPSTSENDDDAGLGER